VLISKLGAKANTKVSTEVRKSKLGKPKKGAKPDAATTAKLEDREVVKYASAHDLRRSFGERWSQKVMPAVLQQMMRHESIDTTMKFYVGRNAQVTAEAIYATVGNTFGNTPAFSPACTPSRGA
jgi:Phage integrase family.